MPGMNGLVATRTLKKRQPHARHRHADAARRRCVPAGAAARRRVRLRAEAERADELLQAIRAAAAGGQYLDSALTARVTARYLATRAEDRRRNRHVSERESEVLRLIASGYSNKEIAARLALSVKTVEAHKANAMRKLGLTGRIDIVKYAILQGWLPNT